MQCLGYEQVPRARSAALALAMAALLCSSGEAAAQTAPEAGVKPPADADGSSRAVELFRRGNQLYNDEKWQEAEATFEAAWAQKRTFDIAVNLGHTELRLKKPHEAAEHLAFAIRNWPLVGKAEQRELAEQRLAEARAQVGALVVRASVAGAVIRIDGTKAGESPLSSEVFVMPGSHTIEAELADHEPASVFVVIGKGGSREVSLRLHRRAEDKGKSTALLVTGASVSLVAAGFGVGFMLAAGARSADAYNAAEGSEPWICNPNAIHALRDVEKTRAICAEVSDARRDQQTLQNIAVGAFVTGGAVGLATVVYALWPFTEPERRTGVRVQPVITQRDGGVWVSGRF